MHDVHSQAASLKPRNFFRYRDSTHPYIGSTLTGRDFCNADGGCASALSESTMCAREAALQNLEARVVNREVRT
jgi:hypothetical protein